MAQFGSGYSGYSGYCITIVWSRCKVTTGIPGPRASQGSEVRRHLHRGMDHLPIRNWDSNMDNIIYQKHSKTIKISATCAKNWNTRIPSHGLSQNVSKCYSLTLPSLPLAHPRIFVFVAQVQPYLERISRRAEMGC